MFTTNKLKQRGEEIVIKKEKGKSATQLKEESGIRKGYEIGGGEDVVF